MPRTERSAASRFRRIVLGHGDNDPAAPAGVYRRRALWFAAAALASLLALIAVLTIIAIGVLTWLVALVIGLAAAALTCAAIAFGQRGPRTGADR